MKHAPIVTTTNRAGTCPLCSGKTRRVGNLWRCGNVAWRASGAVPRRGRPVRCPRRLHRAEVFIG